MRRSTRWYATVVAAALVAVGCAAQGLAGVPASTVPSSAARAMPVATTPSSAPNGVLRFNVAVIGDSLAAGDNVAPADRWPTLVGNRLTSAYPTWHPMVSVVALGGTKIGDAEAQLAGLPDRLYDVAFILTGGNDTGSRPAWQARLAALVATAEARGMTVVLATHPAAMENGHFVSPTDPVAVAIREVAQGRILVDYDAEMRKLSENAASAMHADAVHMNPDGQGWMADLALPVLVSLGPH
jgi:lysophospholipase L1-like esterase